MLHLALINKRQDVIRALYTSGLFGIMMSWESFPEIHQSMKNCIQKFTDYEVSLNLLQKMIRRGLTEEAKKLITVHPNLVQTPSGDGTTSIHWAAINGDTELIDILAKVKVDYLTKPDYQGDTPILLATKNGRCDIVQHMLKEYKVMTDTTELLEAAIEGNVPDMIYTVLPLAKPEVCMVYRAVALDNLAVYDKLKFLVNQDNVDRCGDQAGQTMFMVACQRGNLEIAKDLLRYSPTLCSTDRKKKNLLHLSQESGSVKMFQFVVQTLKEKSLLDTLIEGRNLRNGGESSFLVVGTDMGKRGFHFIEVERGLHQKMRSILKSGGPCDVAEYGVVIKSGWGTPTEADRKEIDIKYSYGAISKKIKNLPDDMTPLHYAVWYGRPKMATILIKEGAKVAARDCFDMTPAHYIAIKGLEDAETVLGLIKEMNPANPTFRERDYKGRTLSDLAKLNDNHRLLDLIPELARGQCLAGQCQGDGQCVKMNNNNKKGKKKKLSVIKFCGAVSAEPPTMPPDIMKILDKVSDDEAIKRKFKVLDKAHLVEGMKITSSLNMLQLSVLLMKPRAVLAIHYAGLFDLLYHEKTDDGFTACDIASKLKDNKEMLKLLKKLKLEEDYAPPLHRMAQRGDCQAVEALIRNHPEMLPMNYLRLLFCAVASGSKEVVEMLCVSELWINARPLAKKGLILSSLVYKRHDILKFLLKRYPLDGNSSLLIPDAVKFNKDVESLEILRSHGISIPPSWISWLLLKGRIDLINDSDINFKHLEGGGKTALLMAAQLGDLKQIKQILKKGGDPLIKDSKNRNILHVSTDYTYDFHNKLMSMLSGDPLMKDSKNTSVDEKSDFHKKVISMLSKKELEELIDQKSHHLMSIVIVTNQHNGKLVFTIMELSRLKITQFRKVGGQLKPTDLFNYGIILKSGEGSPSPKDRRFALDLMKSMENSAPDTTPLQYAILKEQPEFALELIKAGANFKIKDRFGLTPAHAAAMMGYQKVLQALHNAGDKFTDQCNNGLLPIGIARINGCDEIVNYLSSV